MAEELRKNDNGRRDELMRQIMEGLEGLSRKDLEDVLAKALVLGSKGE